MISGTLGLLFQVAFFIVWVSLFSAASSNSSGQPTAKVRFVADRLSRDGR